MENCPQCGRPVIGEKKLVTTCVDCLTARYLVELHAREAEHLAKVQGTPVLVVAELGRPPRRHLLLATEHSRTYCNAPATAPAHKKTRYPLASLPNDVCRECAAKLAEVLASAQAMAPRGPL